MSCEANENESEPSHCTCYRSRGCPRNSAVLLTLLLSSLERVGTFFAVSKFAVLLEHLQILNRDTEIICYICISVISSVLYPFTGYLADVRYGRFRIITAGFVLCTICHFIQSVNFLIVDDNRILSVIIFVVAYTALISGIAAVQGNILPFACDQVLRATGEELSSLFHWYFWTRNIGALFSVLLQVLFKATELDDLQRASLISVLAAANCCLALVIIFCYRHYFYVRGERRNPLQLVFRVTHSAFKATYDPYQSAFTINKDRPPRLDLAKRRHGGPFTTLQVENVKTFYRLLLVLCSMVTIFLLVEGVPDEFSSLLISTNSFFENNKLGNYYFSSSYFNVIIIPLMDRCLYPALGAYTPSMLQRIGIGFVVLIAAVIILTMMTRIDILLHIVAIGICLFIFAVGEVLSVIAGMEFVYAQSPKDIKGLMIGVYYFFNEIGRTLSLVIVLFINFRRNFSDTFWYNIVVLIITVPGFFVYLWIAIRYKRRRWDDEAADEDNVTYENALKVLRMQMNAR